MRKLLLTGFQPFGGEGINPSWEAVKLVPDTLNDIEITKLKVPVVYGLAGETVLKKAQELKPDMIICVGQAGGRAAVTPEWVAINNRTARIPDNDGNQMQDEKVRADGPDGLFSTLPIRKMTDAMNASGVSGSISYTAGTFVCNDLLYTVLDHFSGTDTKACFIHVPFLPEQAKDKYPSMTLEDMAKALVAAISVL